MHKVKIEFRLFGPAARYMPESRRDGVCNLELDQGTKVKELLDGLEIPLDFRKIVLVNGLDSDEEAVLEDGDRLAVFPPLAGG
jgi:molybdopterin converting factor small subunit